MDDFNNLRIKVYLFKVNRKQFFLIYGLTFVFLLIFLIFTIITPPEYFEKYKIFLSINKLTYIIILLVSLVWLVIEAQFFWNRFTKKQLQIIEKQKEIISEKNEELKQQNEEILSQRDEIALQRDLINKKQLETENSIIYAKRIQDVLLNNDDFKNSSDFEYFIMFEPRNIVSGDFYWLKQINNYSFIVASDCTGHGVPGAFMSMLGISFLNEIVTNREIYKPSDVLNELRRLVKIALHQSGKIGEQQDGMDMAFCCLDNISMKLQFAGAYLPLWLIKNEKNIDQNNSPLIIYNSDKMPIGIHPRDNNEFTNHEIQLNSGDRFYIFSDGYESQFGGEKDEKLKSKRFKEIILNQSFKPLSEQKIEIENEFHLWKKDSVQTDDVLVIGVKI